MTDDISANEIQDSQITILLPEWLLLNTAELAVVKGMTIDQLANTALAEYLQRHLQKKSID